jgi:hypothetical protein
MRRDIRQLPLCLLSSINSWLPSYQQSMYHAPEVQEKVMLKAFLKGPLEAPMKLYKHYLVVLPSNLHLRIRAPPKHQISPTSLHVLSTQLYFPPWEQSKTQQNSGRGLRHALQAQSLEFKLQYYQKKKISVIEKERFMSSLSIWAFIYSLKRSSKEFFYSLTFKTIN